MCWVGEGLVWGWTLATWIELAIVYGHVVRRVDLRAWNEGWPLHCSSPHHRVREIVLWRLESLIIDIWLVIISRILMHEYLLALGADWGIHLFCHHIVLRSCSLNPSHTQDYLLLIDLQPVLDLNDFLWFIVMISIVIFTTIRKFREIWLCTQRSIIKLRTFLRLMFKPFWLLFSSITHPLLSQFKLYRIYV